MRSALLLVLLGGCATTSSGPAMPEEYKATGEVMVLQNSATFDAWRVVNPTCNVKRRSDGSWGGTLEGQPIDVNVYENRISGVGLVFTREIKDRKLIITGQFQGRIVRFELDEAQALLRTPRQSYTLQGHTEKEGLFTWGANAELQLKGEAAQVVPPWPQIVFALIAAT